MRILTIAMFVAVVLCAASGCDSDDPVRGEPQSCEEDPSVFITFPDPSYGGPYGRVVDFEWVSDTPCEIQSVRYLIMQSMQPNYVLSTLNEDPESFEEYWSRWKSFNCPQGQAIRLEEELGSGFNLLAVQARSADGKMTAEFVKHRNARIFWSRDMLGGPYLSMSENNYLGDLDDYYPDSYPGVEFKWEVAGGCRLKFRIEANAECYGRRVAGYRSGWDIDDLNNWEEPFIDDNEIPESGFDEGEHDLTIQAIDDLGNVGSKTFRFDFIPMTMERDLLWIDDFPSTNYPNPMRTMPTEDEHDLFWEGLCARNAGFDPGVDIYDVMENDNEPPTLELLSHYKNVIWTYSSASISNAWAQMLQQPDGEKKTNFLPMFMAQGGHIWTLGRPGGLRKVHSDYTYLPVSVECPLSGDFTIDPMPYRDYGVTVVDAVVGNFLYGEEMPPGTFRDVDRDALLFANLDESDPVTLSHPDLPDTLELWDEITDCPVCFFNLRDRGFLYVEVYNPQYWMDFKFLADQPDFHPMYRMRSMSLISPLNDQTIAIWVTKYDDVIPNVTSGPAVAASSVHMGFPLWFFDHDKANQIADVIFEEWGLLE